MTSSRLTKQTHKQLRQLCSTAYARELNRHLGKLDQKFDEWRKNNIDGSELNELIHQFHDGISRDLFKLYNYTKNDLLLVSRAATLGFLEKSEIPEEVPILPNLWENEE